MRIHRVTLEGFGPYRGREVVDLDAFEPDGIFLITGRTGAGKTSILDAITYALFGRVPRYDGLAGDRVRSDHLAPTEVCEVQLEFTVPAGRHRITRRPAHVRPKKRGTGTTPVKAFFEMAVDGPDGWEVVETREGNADRYVGDVVPLTAEQFQQVILLAQGEFQQFLVADSTTRRQLLSRLFDTSRFTAYSDDLTARARQLGQEVERTSAALTSHLTTFCEQAGVELPSHVDPTLGTGVEPWLGEVEEQHVAVLVAHRDAVSAAATSHAADRRRLDDARALVERQQRLTTWQRRQELLAARAAEIEEVRAQVDRARRAAVAWQALRAVEDAADGVARAELVVARVQEQHEVLVAAPAPEGGELAEEVTRLTETVGSLAPARAAEAGLRALDDARTLAESTLEQFEESAAATRRDRAQVDADAEALRVRRQHLEEVLAGTDGCDVAVEQARTGLQAAREVERLTADLGSALEAQQRASDAAAARVEERRALLARQYAEYAGVLASGLADGDDCPVCGSREHPAKASLVEGHVSSDQLEAAGDEVEWAEKRLSEAIARVASLQALLGAARERCGDRGTDAWQTELDAATEQARRRDDAVRERRELDHLHQQLDRRRQLLDEALEVEQSERSRLTEAVALSRQESESARRTVEEARGDHPTVADRVAGIEARLAVLRRLALARDGLDQARTAEATARAGFAVALTEQELADADEVRAARLDEGVLTARAHQVAEHDTQVGVVREALSAPDLRDVPTEPVDLASLEEAERASRQAHAVALQAYGAVEEQHRSLTATAGRIRAALEGSARGRREYAVLSGLAETLRGQGQNERRMTLESFALAAELEEIVAAANGRLAGMTDGRYQFRHSDAVASHGARSGLALDVLDAHTGECRSPRSLSGGEKFQASLALALGLAEVVTARAGGLRLDTLFVDEGFGSLDPETLESTMATLDSLREGGRTVGLISHVATLKETVPAQLHVEVTPGGWSTLADTPA